MANINVELSHKIIDGEPLTFKAPCDCSSVTGIKVEYPNGEDMAFKVFAFADAHGNNLTAVDNLFSKGAMVKVILDIASSKAFVQNADTNAYLEGKFASKAPAGYGLGQYARASDPINDCNGALTNGWYPISAETKNNPLNAGGVIRVDSFNGNAILQTLFSGSYGTKTHVVLQRAMNLGVWGEWEWENPPLEVGIEYRTVERFSGLPVYKKFVDLGQIATGGTIEVSHGIEGVRYPLDVKFTIGSGATGGEALFTKEKLKITVPAEVISGRAYAILSYCVDRTAN